MSANMGAQLSSMAQAAQAGGEANPKDYPGAFALFRGSDKSMLEDGKDVGIPGMGGYGMGEILFGAGNLGVASGILGKIFEFFNLDREGFWAAHVGGGTGNDSGMRAEAGSYAAHEANIASKNMASDSYKQLDFSGTGGGSNASSSSSSSSSSGGSGGGGSNHAFSSIASAASDFVYSGASFVGNVRTGTAVSPDATPTKGSGMGMGASTR
jgi:hypothetical protein